MSRPQGQMMIQSGSSSASLSLYTALDAAAPVPSLLGFKGCVPPAMLISCGVQWPAGKMGSNHSSSATALCWSVLGCDATSADAAFSRAWRAATAAAAWSCRPRASPTTRASLSTSCGGDGWREAGGGGSVERGAGCGGGVQEKSVIERGVGGGAFRCGQKDACMPAAQASASLRAREPTSMLKGFRLMILGRSAACCPPAAPAGAASSAAISRTTASTRLRSTLHTLQSD